MADIFVNYRHEDGDAAGRLADRLCDEFDTFIDTAMESGDSISAEISDALRDTRILLAVIGKEWLSKKNLRRLHEPRDWIRRELLEVLARADVRLVPVLVHKTVEMPKEAMLPRELAGFIDKRAERLRYDTWREDLNNLVESIRSWLSVARPPRGFKTSMPSDVPFLCDRVEQEYDLSQLVADLQRTRSLICILHGHKWEAHAKFISRLSQLGLLDKLFGAGAAGVGQNFLDWNSSLASAHRFDELLRYAIKSNVMQNPLAKDEQLIAFLRNPGRPSVFVMQVTEADLQQSGPETLPRLVQSWNGVIASLGGALTNSLVLWINVSYDESSTHIAWEGLPALRQLEPLTDGHIQTWLNRKEVQAYAAGRTTEILRLTEDPRLFVRRGQIRMQTFADAVNSLFRDQQPSRNS